MEGEYSKNKKLLERKFILWTIQNDLASALGKKTQPIEISVIVDDKPSEAIQDSEKKESSIIADQQQKIGAKNYNTITFLLILLIVFVIGGILFYQFVGSRRINITSDDIPRVGKVDLLKDKDKVDTPIVVLDATSSDNIEDISTSTDFLNATTTITSPTDTFNTTTIISTTTFSTTTNATTSISTSTFTSTSTPEVKQPRSLIPADLVQTIEITNLNQIWDRIEEYSQKLYDQDIKLVRLVFVLNDDLGPRAPTLEEFIGGFGFSMPRNILAKTSSKVYNFFLFKQDENFQNIDFKTRSALLMEIEDNSDFITLVRDWENFILADLTPRFFLKIIPGKSRSIGFQDSQYPSKESSMIFRFANYPDPDVSIDYMIDTSRKIFLLAGSREASWYIVDKIKKISQQ